MLERKQVLLPALAVPPRVPCSSRRRQLVSMHVVLLSHPRRLSFAEERVFLVRSEDRYLEGG